MINVLKYWLIVIFVVFFVLSFNSMLFVSPTYDEPYHIVGGLSAWYGYSLPFYAGDPPLINMISAFPLLFLNIVIPEYEYNWPDKDFSVYSLRLLFDENNTYLLFLLARLPMIVLGVLGGVFVAKWAGEVYGFEAGIVAALLYSFYPLVLGLSNIVMTDLGTVAFMIACLFYFWRFLNEPNWRNIILFSVWFGFSLVSKFNSVFLVPVLVFAFGVSWLKNRSLLSKRTIKFFFFSLILVLLIVNATYGFKGFLRTPYNSIMSDPHVDVGKYNPEVLLASFPVLVWLSKVVPSPFPYYYIKGFGYNVLAQGQKWPIYINGKIYEGGRRDYFLQSFLFKSPFPFLILTLLTLGYSLWRKSLDPVQLLLLSTIVVFMFMMSLSGRQFGFRYVVIVIPCLAIWISGFVVKLSHWRKWFCWFLIACFVLGSFVAFPFYYSYSNFMLPPDKSSLYFGGLNSDLGQSLGLLNDYSESKNISVMKLKYFGNVDRSYMDFSWVEPSCERESGWVAISSYYLVNDCYSWLRNFEPVAILGHTIFVYYVKE